MQDNQPSKPKKGYGLLALALLLPGGVALLVWWALSRRKSEIPEAFSPSATMTKNIKNNNPGNLRYTGTQWKGLVGQDAKGFCVFDTALNGLRACALNALGYQYNHNVTTLRAFGLLWAPPSDNGGASDYGSHLAHQLGIGEDEFFSVRDNLPALVHAIAINEGSADENHNSINDIDEAFPPQLIAQGSALAIDYMGV